jgi:translation initiation factor 2B subunit (eIF-2B alpha/beta/delta family)
MEDLATLIAEIGADRESGASEIVQRAIDVLGRVMSRPPQERLQVARAICHAQPGMAPIWNAALAAMADDGSQTGFERFVRRVRRAPAALSRVTGEVFSDPDARKPDALSIVTISSSASVRQGLAAIARARPLRVACAEGRPAFEGRRMASALADAGAAVTLFSDAAIAEALHDANAILVGADAVASDWFMNKVGTRMLAAAASLCGVPVYVVASRDKFCALTLAAFIIPRDGVRAEIWDAPPRGIVVRNPYFERVPMDLVTGIITDAGLMPSASVKPFCESLAAASPIEAVERLALP